MMEQSNVKSTGMEYNTEQPTMVISEYGRNVIRMIDYCKSIADKEERNRCARSIIRVMAILNPSLKDYADYEHKLWDHLFIMSDYQLDVDCPFPKPKPEDRASRPEPMKYPQTDIKYRHYGKILEDLIEKAMKEEDPKNREVFTDSLAQLMKRQYLNWNRDSVNDQLLVEQLEELSGGKLKVSEQFRFLHTNEILPRNAIPQNQMSHAANKKKKKKKR